MGVIDKLGLGKKTDSAPVKPHEVLCFTTQGREVCVRYEDLPKIFNNKNKVKPEEISSWTLMRIQSEFVKGFHFLKRFKKAVTIHGSARTAPGKVDYTESTELGYKLAKAGFAVITGGGPGIMEAANKGAFDAGGRSVGINIRLPMEQRTNMYVHESESFDFFFTRKVMLEVASQVYVFFPGGFGTLDEFFEEVTLIQTHKIAPIPIVLVDKDFWTPLVEWMKKAMLQDSKYIDAKDLELFTIVADAEEAYAHIKKLPKNKHLFN